MSKGAFTSIIGHETACDVLSRMIKNERLTHAFLFIGPSSVGKTTVAKALLREVMGKGVVLDAHPDVVVLERLEDEKTGKKKTALSVKQIRALRERLSMSAIDGGWKVVLIEEAELLTTAAANALLKTLEEPSGKTMIILCAPAVSSVPQTIASRCQLLRFHLVSREVITQSLVERGLTKTQAKQFATLSAGRPGRSLRLIQDGGFRAQMETAVSATLELFHAPKAKRLSLIKSLLPKEEINNQQVFLEQINTWEQVVRDQLLQTVGCGDHAIHPSS